METINLCHRIQCKSCQVFTCAESARRSLEAYSLNRVFNNQQQVYLCLTRYLEAQMNFLSYVIPKGVENFESPNDCLRREPDFQCIVSVLKVYSTQPMEFGEYITASKKLIAGKEGSPLDMVTIRQSLEQTTSILKHKYPYQAFVFVQAVRQLKSGLAKRGYYTTSLGLEQLIPFSQINWLSLLPVFCRKLDILYCRPVFPMAENLKQPPPFSEMFLMKFKDHIYVLLLSFLSEVLCENLMNLKLNKMNSLFAIHKTLPQHRNLSFFFDQSYFSIYDENVTETTFLKICLNVFNSKNFGSFNLTKMLAYFLKSNAVKVEATCASPLCKRRKTH